MHQILPQSSQGADAMTAKREVLNVRGLSAGYGPMRVIHDLDLVVNSGERVGLVGLNGHGKSTLFYAIAGLTGWQRGSIKLNGIEVGRTRSQGPGRYTHQIVQIGLALMPQGDEIFHGLTVEEHLDSGAFTPRAWRERAKRKERVLQVFPPLTQADAHSGRPAVGRRTAHGLDRARARWRTLRCSSSTSRRSVWRRRSAKA